MTRRQPETWHARAPFWVGLALTALSGLVTVKAQLAALESSQAIGNARLTALEVRCKP